MVILEGSERETGDMPEGHSLERARKPFIQINTDLKQNRIQPWAHQNLEIFPLKSDGAPTLHFQHYDGWKDRYGKPNYMTIQSNKKNTTGLPLYLLAKWLRTGKFKETHTTVTNHVSLTCPPGTMAQDQRSVRSAPSATHCKSISPPRHTDAKCSLGEPHAKGRGTFTSRAMWWLLIKIKAAQERAERPVHYDHENWVHTNMGFPISRGEGENGAAKLCPIPHTRNFQINWRKKF